MGKLKDGKNRLLEKDFHLKKLFPILEHFLQDKKLTSFIDEAE